MEDFTAEIESGRVDASAEEIAAADECSNHWVHITKVIVVIGKIVIAILMMMVAVYAYHAKYKRWTMIPVLLSFYILCVSAPFAY